MKISSFLVPINKIGELLIFDWTIVFSFLVSRFSFLGGNAASKVAGMIAAVTLARVTSLQQAASKVAGMIAAVTLARVTSLQQAASNVAGMIAAVTLARVTSLQQAASNVAGMIAAVYVVCAAVCAADNEALQTMLMSTTLFAAGVATVAQCSLGVR